MPTKARKSQYVSGSELARKAGYSNGFITQMRQSGRLAGCFRKARGKKYIVYHLEKCLEIFKEMDVSRSKKRSQNPTGEYNAERAKLIKAQRKRIEFNQNIQEGEYIQAKYVENQNFTIGRILRDHLLNLPAKLAALCSAKSKKKEKEIYQILHHGITAGLNEAIESLKKTGGNEEANV